MEKTIEINSVDVSSKFPRFGYTVTYTKIHGANEGTMLDGSFHEDIIGLKAIIDLKLIPQSEAAMQAFITSLYSTDYPQVYYFDPKTGQYRTIYTFIVNDLQLRHEFINVNNVNIWSLVGSLTLRER